LLDLAPAEAELEPFGSSQGVGKLLLSPRHQAIHEGVVTVRIMVEQHQSLHTAFPGDAHALLP
jgi:hypothetical protein